MRKGIAFLLAVAILTVLAAPVSVYASYGYITIDTNVRVVNGRVTVSWTDTGNCGPYSVIYEYYDGSDTPQCRFWRSKTCQNRYSQKKRYALSHCLFPPNNFF